MSITLFKNLVPSATYNIMKTTLCTKPTNGRLFITNYKHYPRKPMNHLNWGVGQKGITAIKLHSVRITCVEL